MTPQETGPQEAVERALAAARSDDCVVIADETSSANLRWAGNTLTTNGVSRSRQLTVVAISRDARGARAGVVSRAGVRGDQVADVVRAAEQAAAESSPAEDAQPVLRPGQGEAFGISAHASTGQATWEDPVAGTEIGVFRSFSAALGGAFDAAGSAGQRLYGFAQHSVTSTFLGTSTGLRLRHDQPTGMVDINAKSADLTGSAWAGQGTRDFTDVDVAAVCGGLSQRLEWAKRRVDLPAGRYETVLPPAAVADLLIYLYWSSGARDALDGRTVFSKAGGGTRVGDRLTGLPLTLRSDPTPTAAPGLGSAPFVIAHASTRQSSVFDNGLRLQPTDWISGGELAALVQTRHSAGLSGLPVTPAIGNLILDGGGSASLDEMIADTGRGLLLTCLWYIREVDPQTLLLTGLTRDGTYLVENGEVTAAVNNFRFNESPVSMLARITEVGATTATLSREWGDYFARAAMPPVRVDGFNMSSVSQAS
ncbi:MAG TPA: metallopeptidase TldD-related protein [Streptosporangiaceae bacterium]|jgi:predicted Zn-dependent protease|nr:metallopeptidase TldD-related protein [Streptosporangiaceae bacterium]